MFRGVVLFVCMFVILIGGDNEAPYIYRFALQCWETKYYF